MIIMDKINFEPISKAMEAFDTDKIDTGRKGDIKNPNSTSRETTPDIPCHLPFENIDNPYLNTAETQPLNKELAINCPVIVDLKNGDFITTYKLENEGNVLEQCNGVIREPNTSMSRKSSQMMNI
jgi:hypothetical protein